MGILKLYALSISDMMYGTTPYVASTTFPRKNQIKKLLAEYTSFDPESDFAVYNHRPTSKSPRHPHDFNIEIDARGTVSETDLSILERLSIHKVVKL